MSETAPTTPETAAAAPADPAAGSARNRRSTVIGTVTSDKMHKTCVVKINTLVKHPIFKKYVKRRTAFYVHDENNEAKVGDEIEIMATRPLSKRKNWRLVRIVRKGTAQ